MNGHLVPITLDRLDDTYQYATEHFDERAATVAFMPARLTKDFDQIVPSDRVVLFGDNRDNAKDSRYVGMVPKTNIDGLVVKVFRPHE